MKRLRSGWQWNLLRYLPDWVLKMRIAFLKNILKRKQDIEDEISDCEELISFRSFRREVKEAYIQMFHEPFPEGPVWPIKDDKRMPSNSGITDKTIVISKAEMDKSFKEYENRLKGIRKDMQM